MEIFQKNRFFIDTSALSFYTLPDKLLVEGKNMKTKKLLNWLISIVAFVVLLFTSNRLTAATNKSQSINQITKNTPLILQHASATAIVNLDHSSHVSHASHASHASHFSHYSS